jgi:hypothetical protein
VTEFSFYQYHAGRLASVLSPEDNEFINMVLAKSSSEERQPVPIWMMEDDLVSILGHHAKFNMG